MNESCGRLSVLAGVMFWTLIAIAGPMSAQRADDHVWKAFLAWLQQAPPLAGPVEAIKGFEQSIVGDGAAPDEANREVAVVRRLMA